MYPTMNPSHATFLPTYLSSARSPMSARLCAAARNGLSRSRSRPLRVRSCCRCRRARARLRRSLPRLVAACHCRRPLLLLVDAISDDLAVDLLGHRGDGVLAVCPLLRLRPTNGNIVARRHRRPFAVIRARSFWHRHVICRELVRVPTPALRAMPASVFWIDADLRALDLREAVGLVSPRNSPSARSFARRVRRASRSASWRSTPAGTFVAVAVSAGWIEGSPSRLNCPSVLRSIGSSSAV